jgi:hypothetical protein
MVWQFQPYLLVLVIGIGMALIVAVVAWRRRETPGALPLALTMLAAALWAGLDVCEYAVVGYGYKLTFSKLQYVGIASVPVLWLIFALAYCGYQRFLTRRNLILLWIIPVITILMALTNDLHSWMWNVRVNAQDPTARWIACFAWLVVHRLFTTMPPLSPARSVMVRTALIFRRELRRKWCCC